MRRYQYIWAACIVGCFFMSACENSQQEVRDLNSKKLGIEEAKDIEVTFTIGGHTKAILTSPLMLRVQDTVPYVEFPNTLHVNFYNEQGLRESILDAKYARYKESENIFFLRDSVRVINIIKHDTLYAEEMYWDRSRTGREFYTDKKVKIRTPTQKTDGTGMEARQDFKSWLITYPTGPIDIPAGSFPR